jgi:ATP-dependent phosphofructokinase / diphosphate-dependent phosphofructokinase
MKNLTKQGKIAVIASGGPAPGINCVISSSAIEGINNGFSVVGIVDGFRGLCSGDPNAIMELNYSSISGIYNTGGSILGTTRYNPFSSDETQGALVANLERYNIDKLIVIGGEGSAYLSYQIYKRLQNIQVVHVPKTIDNDLILPNKYPSFGFETARYAGTKILDTLTIDAKTSRRWFLVTSMGRKAGFLALGLGIASGATMTLIPEEYSDRSVKPSEIVDTIFQCMKKRYTIGKAYGLVIVAEGILDCIDPKSNSMLQDCARDELGRIRYSQIEVSDVLLPAIRERVKNDGLDLKIIPKNIGYELRCHNPVSFDIEYTKFLGYGAVRLLREGHSGVMVTRDFDNIGFEQLEGMIGSNGLIKSRNVDLNSDLYKVARSFMMR